MIAIICVALGGFFGSVLRYQIAMKVNKHPIGTWIVNIIGALFLGLMLKLYQMDAISGHVWLVGGVGFSGAFTTFSTFSNEVLEYILQNKLKQALVYAGSSFLTAVVLVCFVLAV